MLYITTDVVIPCYDFIPQKCLQMTYANAIWLEKYMVQNQGHLHLYSVF